MSVCLCVSTAEVPASVEEVSFQEVLRKEEGHSSRVAVGTVHEGLPMEEQKEEGQVERDHREKREEKVSKANFDTQRISHNTHTYTHTHTHTHMHTHAHTCTHAHTHTHTCTRQRLAVMMMSRKRKRLYEQILKSRRKKATEVKQLKRKRREHEALAAAKKAKVS